MGRHEKKKKSTSPRISTPIKGVRKRLLDGGLSRSILREERSTVLFELSIVIILLWHYLMRYEVNNKWYASNRKKQWKIHETQTVLNIIKK